MRRFGRHHFSQPHHRIAGISRKDSLLGQRLALAVHCSRARRGVSLHVRLPEIEYGRGRQVNDATTAQAQPTGKDFNSSDVNLIGMFGISAATREAIDRGADDRGFSLGNCHICNRRVSKVEEMMFAFRGKPPRRAINTSSIRRQHAAKGGAYQTVSSNHKNRHVGLCLSSLGENQCNIPCATTAAS